MKRKRMIGIIILLLAIIAIGSHSGIVKLVYVLYINSVEVTEFRVEDTTLYMDGLINSKTHDQLKNVVAKNPQLDTIIMLDVPGSADDEVNLSMASWVRSKGFHTYLTSTSHVASGGTDFFLSGVERTVEEGARVGVHSWGYDGISEGSSLPKTDPAHEMNRKYTEYMLGKDDFYWYTLEAASAGDMHYMTIEEMKYYNVYTKLVPQKE